MTAVSPPVPAGLRDALKDYPEYLERVQEALDEVVSSPPRGTPAFQSAVWAIEARLESFFFEANDELRDAKEAGSPETVSSAQLKRDAMSRAAWKHVWIGDSEFRKFFEAEKSDQQ